MIGCFRRPALGIFLHRNTSEMLERELDPQVVLTCHRNKPVDAPRFFFVVLTCNLFDIPKLVTQPYPDIVTAIPGKALHPFLDFLKGGFRIFLVNSTWI